MMLKKNLKWNAQIIKHEKIIKKDDYLKLFFKKFPKKLYQVIFNVFIKILGIFSI